MADPSGRRRAGLLIPLFSFPSTRSWGIGEIADIPAIAGWLAAGRQRVLQLLPINEMAPGQSSPYSAISAMGIDPIFISLRDVPEFQALGGETALDPEARARLAEVRAAPHVDHAAVRALKNDALRRAFDRFDAAEWTRQTERAREFARFVAGQAWWIDDYALFRALHANADERPWTEWPEDLQRREADALERARRELGREVRYWQYLQWIADTQWRDARAGAQGVALFGDLPFMVDGDSADVWARQHQFYLDASVGAPPDAFSATGQDWGMPVYRWDAIAADDFRWLRDRARRSADLFDGYRVDHLVGFYRTYGRPKNGGAPFFTPADEAAQLALGERVLDIFKEAGAEIVAEDLGTVPDAVRASLAKSAVPGFRVFRWERHWHTPGQPFRDPSEYPPMSVATSGTHDTEPLVVWWENAPPDDKQAVTVLQTAQRVMNGRSIADAPYNPVVRDTLLEVLFAAASDLLLFPVQDVFGWPDRINEPATVGEGNWRFKLPWPCDRLEDIPEARERQEMLRGWAAQYGRS